MDALLPAFLDEARLLLDRSGRSLRALLNDFSIEEFEQVFRSIHTLKSSARTVGLHDLGSLFHKIETEWEMSRGGVPTKDLIERLLRISEALSYALEEGRMGEPQTLSLSNELWEGRGASILSRLAIPSDIHLSSVHYERLMGATESVLLAKMKVEALGNSLLRALDRTGKNEQTMGHEYQSATGVLSRATTDLENSLREVRMTPLSVFFDRIPLLVKDMGGFLHKAVTLHVSGGELEADRLVIGELGGVLGHLVRNAIDHGISTEGVVRVEARQDHDHLLISVEDDGQGIQYGILEEVAKSRGMIDSHMILSDEARKELLFHPHLSTTKEVTEVSGRGVGMSAVREYVRSVGGNVVVESPLSVGGTRVTLRIPTTLSLIRILLVRAGHATLGIPMTDIQETITFDGHSVREENGRHVVDVKGETLPFLRLSHILSLEGGYQYKGNPFLLRFDVSGHHVAVCVDAVLHEEEVLVRSLPRLLSPLALFRGAAMVSDGRIILVLDGVALANAPAPALVPGEKKHQKLEVNERDQLMEIMNMVASHAGSALARRFGSHIELSVPECADGKESLVEEDWGASAVGVRMDLEGAYPGKLLFEIPATLCARLTKNLYSKQSDLHDLSSEERAFFQEIGQIAMHAVGNMLSKISKHPVMTKMSDIRVDARGALRTYFLSGHQGLPEEQVRVRLWFGVGEGIRTDDHRETGSLTMELRREDAKRLLSESGALLG